MRLLLALPLALLQDPAGVDRSAELSKLLDRARAYAELVEAYRAAPVSERGELGGQEARERAALSEAYVEFFRAHAATGLDEGLARALVTASQEPAAASLLPTWVGWALENTAPRSFLDSAALLERLELPAPLRARLDHPRAVALFALGEDAEALRLALQRGLALGPGGVLLLDVASAIHAARGEAEQGRQLYRDWLSDYGESAARLAPQVRTKADHLAEPLPPLGPVEWVGPRGTAREPLGAESLRARPLALDFWQSWCGPCRAQMGHLSALQRELGERVLIVGLCRDDASPTEDGRGDRPGADAQGNQLAAASIRGEKYREHVAELVAGLELDYRFAVAPARSDVHERFEVRAFPTIWIANSEGRVVWISAGAGPGLPLLVRTLLTRLARD